MATAPDSSLSEPAAASDEPPPPAEVATPAPDAPRRIVGPGGPDVIVLAGLIGAAIAAEDQPVRVAALGATGLLAASCAVRAVAGSRLGAALAGLSAVRPALRAVAVVLGPGWAWWIAFWATCVGFGLRQLTEELPVAMRGAVLAPRILAETTLGILILALATRWLHYVALGISREEDDRFALRAVAAAQIAVAAIGVAGIRPFAFALDLGPWLLALGTNPLTAGFATGARAALEHPGAWLGVIVGFGGAQYVKWGMVYGPARALRSAMPA